MAGGYLRVMNTSTFPLVHVRTDWLPGVHKSCKHYARVGIQGWKAEGTHAIPREMAVWGATVRNQH